MHTMHSKMESQGVVITQHASSSRWNHILLCTLSLTAITASQAFIQPLPRSSSSSSITSHRHTIIPNGQRPLNTIIHHSRRTRQLPLFSSSSSDDPDKDRINRKFNDLLNDGNDLLELIDHIKRNRNQIDVDWQKVCIPTHLLIRCFPRTCNAIAALLRDDGIMHCSDDILPSSSLLLPHTHRPLSYSIECPIVKHSNEI